MDFREAELGDWLMFQQSENEYPPRNITIRGVGKAWITVFDYNGKSERIRLRISTLGAYRRLLETMLSENNHATLGSTLYRET